MMKQSWIKYIFALVCVMEISVYGQDFPIIASFSISPPYSVYLNDYTEQPTKMSLSLFFKDISASDAKIRLRVEILGNGITIRTKNDYAPPPILIAGGTTEVFDATDLLGYFSTANFEYTGAGRDAFYANSKLPEGFYQICIEALEINRNLTVSNKACSIAWILLNDPPIWNIPTHNSMVTATNPQNVMCSFTPRHTGSPNAAFNTSYEITIAELWPESRNENDAINAQTPFYRFTTNSTSFILGPSEPSMTAGRSYAMRIKAVDETGYDLFKNNGYSEVLKFTFGEPCEPPSELLVSDVSQRSARVKFTPSQRNSSYRLDIREVGTSSAYPLSEWKTYNYNASENTLVNLAANRGYEIQVRGLCQSIVSEPSPSTFFNTLPEHNPGFSCNSRLSLSVPGLAVSEIELPKVGEYLNLNSLRAQIAQIQKDANNKISGIAYLEIPFVNGLKVPFSFSNVSLSSAKDILSGATIAFIKDFQAANVPNAPNINIIPTE